MGPHEVNPQDISNCELVTHNEVLGGVFLQTFLNSSQSREDFLLMEVLKCLSLLFFLGKEGLVKCTFKIDVVINEGVHFVVVDRVCGVMPCFKAR